MQIRLGPGQSRGSTDRVKRKNRKLISGAGAGGGVRSGRRVDLTESVSEKPMKFSTCTICGNYRSGLGCKHPYVTQVI